jgi:predicted metallo-beta-lactamase superfamily hydrolase
MKVIPLAADSLGVRSMATYVEVADTSILIDPGATLAPSRFSLPPAAEEWEALRRANDRISAYAARASMIFVSHYHDDHFRSDPATYAGRMVLAKDPQRMVGGQQARRGAELWTMLNAQARPTVADGYERREHAMELRVSPPLPHGLEATTLGYVVALTIADRFERERFVFASDVQGPLSAVAAGWLIQQRPTLLYLAGPPSYIEREVGTPIIERGIDNLLRIIDATGCRVIMDHHAVREAAFGARFERLWSTGRVVTAAEHVGLPIAALESQRRQLWTAVARKPAMPAPAARAPRARIERPIRKSVNGRDRPWRSPREGGRTS